MKKAIILTLCWLVLAIAGCGSRTALEQTEGWKHEFQVIVHIAARNEVVTIMSGYEGRLYTVTARDGGIIARNICEQELQTNLPHIYHFLKTSYADDGPTDAVWAGD